GLFVGLERRGPGQPGSGRRFPGEHLSRAAGFATGMCLDTMPGCNALAGFAAEAAGEDDRYDGASESRGQAQDILALAHDLEVRLPGTKAAFRDGILRESKAAIIAAATRVLGPAEARAAEAMVPDRAGRLTPAGLRSAIARAVIEVAPEKARKRRELAAKDARVQRWAEDSG